MTRPQRAMHTRPVSTSVYLVTQRSLHFQSHMPYDIASKTFGRKLLTTNGGYRICMPDLVK